MNSLCPWRNFERVGLLLIANKPVMAPETAKLMVLRFLSGMMVLPVSSELPALLVPALLVLVNVGVLVVGRAECTPGIAVLQDARTSKMITIPNNTNHGF